MRSKTRAKLAIPNCCLIYRTGYLAANEKNIDFPIVTVNLTSDLLLSYGTKSHQYFMIDLIDTLTYEELKYLGDITKIFIFGNYIYFCKKFIHL